MKRDFAHPLSHGFRDADYLVRKQNSNPVYGLNKEPAAFADDAPMAEERRQMSDADGPAAHDFHGKQKDRFNGAGDDHRTNSMFDDKKWQHKERVDDLKKPHGFREKGDAMNRNARGCKIGGERFIEYQCVNLAAIIEQPR
jgi:hypothetical protein